MNIRARILVALIGLVGLQVCFGAAKKDYSPYPQADAGYITDIAGVLDEQQEDAIEGWLYATEKETGREIAIVIIHSIRNYPGTANDSIESFARGLFDAYGVGNMPENKGILLVISVSDRKARIELGDGYGFRHGIGARRIMDRVVVPSCRERDYVMAVAAGAQALAEDFAGIIFIPGWVKLVIIALLIVLIPVTISLRHSGRRGWGWVCVGFIIVLLLALLWLLRHTAWRGGGSSPGGFGGGFGGGFSGGGGATGGW